jgi:hypothetical protein
VVHRHFKVLFIVTPAKIFEDTWFKEDFLVENIALIHGPLGLSNSSKIYHVREKEMSCNNVDGKWVGCIELTLNKILQIG